MEALDGRTEMSNVIIRDFVRADQSRVAGLINTGLGQRFGFIDESKNPDLVDIAEFYSGDCFLVALLEGELIGTGALIYESQLVARVARMHTAEAFRRRGIAKAVIAELERRAHGYGAREVMLDTDLDWYDAHGFYKAVGYEEFRRNEFGIRFHKIIA